MTMLVTGAAGFLGSLEEAVPKSIARYRAPSLGERLTINGDRRWRS
jgi:hypothetical protein